MSIALNEKGPAEGGASPSHGPTAAKDAAMNGMDDITTTAGVATPSPDPVVELRTLARIVEGQMERSALTAISDGQSKRPSWRDADVAMAQLCDKLMSIEGEISLHRATSLAGAAVQIKDAIRLVDILVPEGECAQTRRDRRSLVRGLFSALAVIDQASEQHQAFRADLARHAEAHKEMNPWIAIDEVA